MKKKLAKSMFSKESAEQFGAEIALIVKEQLDKISLRIDALEARMDALEAKDASVTAEDLQQHLDAVLGAVSGNQT